MVKDILCMNLLENAKKEIVDTIKLIHEGRTRGFNPKEFQIEFYTTLQNYENIHKIFKIENEDVNEFYRKAMLETGLYFLSDGYKYILPINKENCNISFKRYKEILSIICKKIKWYKKGELCKTITNLLSQSEFNNISISDILFSFEKHNESLNDFVHDEIENNNK